MWLDALRAMKEKSNLTAVEIAAGAGVPKPTLEKILSGETKDPRLPTMRKIVYFLGYKLEDLYKDENAPAQSEDDTEALSAREIGKALAEVGMIPPGRDLSDDDLRFLTAMIAALWDWFGE